MINRYSYTIASYIHTTVRVSTPNHNVKKKMRLCKIQQYAFKGCVFSYALEITVL